ncbi:MAG TPA: response regulator transcription factor [Candidatus Deferrimicrobiaceae bacterium]|jgi:DNA-binding NarL/FixJ family response regulator
MIRVVLVDDHPIVRHGLQVLLAGTGDITVVGEAGDASGLHRLVEETACDLLVLDIGLPGKSGMEVIGDLRRAFPKVGVVVLSMHSDVYYAVRALKAGAGGYLTKVTPPAEVIEAIRKVAAGRRHMCADLAGQIADLLAGDLETPPHERLSDREFEILQMIAAGRKPQEISDALRVGVGTVGTYRTRILHKMNMTSNSELTRYVTEKGLFVD